MKFGWPRAEQLALRRQQLQGRSRGLRSSATLHAQSLQPLFTWVDRVQDGLAWVRSRPPELVWPLAGALGLWVLRRPARLVSLPLKVMTWYRLWQRFVPGARRRVR
jgi:hypothetical protein